LLVADGLPIDQESGFGMVAERMKEAVGIGGDASGRGDRS
jgi:hypothetical protein